MASMKGFPTLTVHLAVNLTDNYLQLRKVSRSRLQLLGIAALLLSSRWTSDYILTVREASWLTKKTYGYDEVAKMTGKLLSVVRGEIGVSVSYYFIFTCGTQVWNTWNLEWWGFDMFNILVGVFSATGK